MVDSSEDPVLTQLRAIRADISELQGSLWEIKQRLAMLESSQGSIVQYLGHLATADAQQQLATDGLIERLAHISRRLDPRES